MATITNELTSQGRSVKQAPTPIRYVLQIGGELAVAMARLLPLRVWEGVVYLAISQGVRSDTVPVIRPHEIGMPVETEYSQLAYKSPEDALYTGRVMHIKEPIDLEKLDLMRPTSKECEHAFRSWFGGSNGYAKLDKVLRLSDGDATSDSFKEAIDQETAPFRIILHEYGHWSIFNGTAMATLYDAASWRVRLCQLVLCEAIHDRTGISRTLDMGFVNELRSKFEDYLGALDQRVASDATVRALLADLAEHQYLSDVFFQTTAAVIVEPVTWALVEPSFVDMKAKYLWKYFHGSQTLYVLASTVLEDSLWYLRRGGTRIELIDAARGALDFPIRDFSYKTGSQDEILDLSRTIAKRFKELLRRESVRFASSQEKTFGSALSYAVSPDVGDHTTGLKVRRLMVHMGARILKRESKIFRYGVHIVENSYGKPTYQTPTVFAVAKFGEGLLKLRYDQLTGLTAADDRRSAIDRLNTRTTGHILNRIDDLVGDLPSSLGTCLLIIRRLEHGQIQEIIEGFPNLRHLSECGQRDQLEKALLDLNSYRSNLGLTYHGILKSERESLRHYFWFWLKFLSLLGEPAKEMYNEHGL